ncbi:Na-translocating system protein MpsC family protein [Alkalihalobacterium alkalicellulosilyticum]|uniref:Na-translocating system protein MpsC family protein n=1 Tax=Alkalihalobacterium alkalicellulosilyticum TaxID=1912214 RepID=UPI000998729D|nr:Na-translocating system protein MpsC family protein [Bacillus alkalicellulosilyticus]
MEQEQIQTINTLINKMIRKNFGRGPKKCQTTISTEYVVTYIDGFVSPMEEMLLLQGQKNQVEKARTAVMNHILEELKGAIKVALDRDVEECYQDWNFPNDTGCIILVLNEEVDREKMYQQKINNPLLEREIARISELVQKVPEEIHIISLTPSICLVERSGILIPIEKALLEKGFDEELRVTKDELEKSYFHRFGKFDEIFNKKVKDIFIDWDFKEDKAFMAFILQ